jgi:hypothetical protein
MEVLESGEQSVLQWDRKLSELSEPGDTEALMYHTVRRRRGRVAFQGEVWSSEQLETGDPARAWPQARGRGAGGRGAFRLSWGSDTSSALR